MRALILAGGKGTRLRPLTHLTPKPLVPFMGDPYAHGLLRRLAAVGVDRVTFLVGDSAAPFDPLLKAEADLGVAIDIATEETPLDTAGAVRRALVGAEAPVLVCNGDVLTDLDLAALLAAHRDGGAVATLALTHVEDTSAFGVVVTDADGAVREFVEKPMPGTVAADTVNAGTYVLDPAAFRHFPGDGPLSFERDVFPGLLARGERMLGFASDAYWQDLGTPMRYLEGHKAVLDGRCAWPLAPEIRLVADGAAVHDQATVHPEARLGPGTVVGAGCVVGAAALLRGAILHDRVTVGAGSVIVDSLIGADSTIGDHVTVPTGSVLGQRSVLGVAD